MFPVWGKPAIGTALALNVTFGVAEATPGITSATSARAGTAKQVIALRIASSLFLSGSGSGKRAPPPFTSSNTAGPPG
jgi:hypothetical protein